MVRPIRKSYIHLHWGVHGSHWALGRHNGNDWAAYKGTSVYATHGGVVVFAGLHGGWGAAYGNHVIMRTYAGLTRFAFCHLSHIEVHRGQRLRAGARIGRSGATGNVTGPHLHYEERHRPFTYGTDRNPRFDK